MAARQAYHKFRRKWLSRILLEGEPHGAKSASACGKEKTPQKLILDCEPSQGVQRQRSIDSGTQRTERARQVELLLVWAICRERSATHVKTRTKEMRVRLSVHCASQRARVHRRTCQRTFVKFIGECQVVTQHLEGTAGLEVIEVGRNTSLAAGSDGESAER